MLSFRRESVFDMGGGMDLKKGVGRGGWTARTRCARYEPWTPLRPAALDVGSKPKIWVIIESAPEMAANKMDMIGFVLRSWRRG